MLLTGTLPQHIWHIPSSVQAISQNCPVRVDMKSVHCLQDEMGGHEGREEAMQFVSAEFAAEADNALWQLGSSYLYHISQ